MSRPVDTTWLDTYNATMSRKDTGPKKAPGVHCCAICCTLFSIFGALFLFVVAGLMNQDYHYLHIPGDMPHLSKSTTYAGIFYLITAVISVVFWIRGAMKAGQFARPASYAAVTH